MTSPRRCRWAGWGNAEDALRLDERPRLLEFLAGSLGGALPAPKPPQGMESVEVPRSKLPPDVVESLRAIVGEPHVRTDREERLLHSLGKSYPDLFRARCGQLEAVTDAVVYPTDAKEVAAILRLATERSVAVVPFGGGTSVVGGLAPLAGRHQAVLTLDLSRMTDVRIDRESLLASVGAGIFGPDLESRLSANGLTLGHFPQSFEFSTLGGWVATRGAGQNSTRYGKIEEMVQAVELVTPEGEIQTRNVPASASGPSALETIVGSEGTLGVICSAQVRVRPLPACSDWQAWLVKDFTTGCQLMRELEQSELPISVARLSDPVETSWMSKASTEDSTSLVARIGKWYVTRRLAKRGARASEVCFALASFEGSDVTVRAGVRRAKTIAGNLSAVGVGRGPGKSWEHERFRLPYLRDELLDRGILVDTLETCTTWSNLSRLYEAVRKAVQDSLAGFGTPGVVMCHLSHLYRTGSSLYFTFLAPQKNGSELEQWRTVKQAATEAIVRHDGALSHHHGIGRDHMPLEAQDGPLAVAALRAAKIRLDPQGVMNPGKLFGQAAAND